MKTTFSFAFIYILQSCTVPTMEEMSGVYRLKYDEYISTLFLNPDTNMRHIVVFPDGRTHISQGEWQLLGNNNNYLHTDSYIHTQMCDSYLSTSDYEIGEINYETSRRFWIFGSPDIFACSNGASFKKIEDF